MLYFLWALLNLSHSLCIWNYGQAAHVALMRLQRAHRVFEVFGKHSNFHSHLHLLDYLLHAHPPYIDQRAYLSGAFVKEQEPR
eukprot:1136419-Pelagomonas_calceolata.AAC.2